MSVDPQQEILWKSGKVRTTFMALLRTSSSLVSAFTAFILPEEWCPVVKPGAVPEVLGKREVTCECCCHCNWI